MKWELCHIRLCYGLLLAYAVLTSCTHANTPDDDNGHTCLLTLHVSLPETRAGSGTDGTASWECMHSLRVVVLSKATGQVEINNFYFLDGGLSSYGPILIPVKPDGTKEIYLIANEASAGTLANESASGKNLSDYLESVAAGSDAGTFRSALTNAVFTVPETYGEECNIPMSAIYQVETSASDSGTTKDCGTFHIVRTVTKYSFSFRNDRVSGYDLYVNSWKISRVTTDQAYLMPHFSSTDDCWGYRWNNSTNGWQPFGTGWSDAGPEWKEWLAKVSDESNIDPDNPSADENGWLTCYDIPAGATQGTLTHTYEGKGLCIPIDGTEHDGEVVRYLPESKQVKESDYAFPGEQEYLVNVCVTENGVPHTFAPVALPNLRSLFRNTHVKVYVRFGQTMEDDVIYAKIIDWRIGKRVEGELRPED